MNVVAPLLVCGLRDRITLPLWRTWPFATTLQLVLIWFWHTPPTLAAAMANVGLMAVMHLSLMVAAMWFWAAILLAPIPTRWRAILALLVTGKLFCLLGAILVFSPRALFATPHMQHGAAGLADQQMAGLIMLTACPLTYVLAGIVISARWFLSLEANAQTDG
jgi:putative membrane protein